MKRPITLVYAALFLTRFRFQSRPRYQLEWGFRDFKPSFSLKNTKKYLKLRHDSPSHILPNLLHIQHPAIRRYTLWDIETTVDKRISKCMIIGTTTEFIKLETNESVMSTSKAHLTTVTGEGDYPAGWYRICTLQVGTEYVPCRLV